MPAVTWITITLAHLSTAKAAALVEQLRTAALGAGQSDPVPEIIVDVTNRIRAEVAAGGKTVMDADATRVPPSLKSIASRMVLREAQSRLSVFGGLPLSEDEVREEKNDLRYLERIAAGGITVETSDNPEATPSVQAPIATPQITARDRQWGRCNQEGA